MALKKQDGRSKDPPVEAIESRACEVFECVHGQCVRKASDERCWRAPWHGDSKRSTTFSSTFPHSETQKKFCTPGSSIVPLFFPETVPPLQEVPSNATRPTVQSPPQLHTHI